jgi:hypothetical protein
MFSHTVFLDAFSIALAIESLGKHGFTLDESEMR